MGARKYTYIETFIPYIWAYRQSNACIVEIGSERGEGSTSYFVEFAKTHGISFYTVDFDPVQYENAKRICEAATVPDSIEIKAFCMKGEDFLTDVFPSINKQIMFLYLDNFDFIYDHLVGLVDNQIAAYKNLGVTMNNKNSKLVHLKQTQLAEPFFHPHGAVLCDDTFKRKDEWDGKCALAVPYLLSKSWHIVESNPGTIHHCHGYVILKPESTN